MPNRTLTALVAAALTAAAVALAVPGHAAPADSAGPFRLLLHSG